MSDLAFIPLAEFERVRALPADSHSIAAAFADMARLNTLYMIARAGSGHIGSSFSSLDIVSWLYLHELRDTDVYFSSKGHDAPGFYSVLIALGVLPFEQLAQLRRLHGLPGHPDVGTAGVVTNTGSLGMGISKAKGMVRANRLDGVDSRIYVMTGDGELQEGQLWESLAGAANDGLAEITVIVDHNKLQSNTWVEQVSDLGDLEAKFSAFGWHVQRIDGHDMGALAAALNTARAHGIQPSVIIADTVKGRGVSFMEPSELGMDELYGFHSGAPDQQTYVRATAELIASINRQLVALSTAPLRVAREDYPQRSAVRDPQRLIGAYAQALKQQGAEHAELVVLDGDLMLDCGLIPFRDEFPERFVECGIAEQDMVSQAGGLALRGKLPVVHSFACFLTPRANEQIYINATEHTRIIYAGSLAGLLPGGPGHSHQSVRDISVLAAVPGLRLVEPCREEEVAMALDYAVNHNPGSTYIRLVSIPVAVPFALPADYRLVPGQGCVLREGRDLAVFSYGPVMLAEAWRAAELLGARGIDVRLVALPWLNHLDADWLVEAVAGCRQVITIDNHYVTGGQGDAIAAALASRGAACTVTRLGLAEIPACGQNPEVLDYHGLDAAHLAATIGSLLG